MTDYRTSKLDGLGIYYNGYRELGRVSDVTPKKHQHN